MFNAIVPSKAKTSQHWAVPRQLLMREAAVSCCRHGTAAASSPWAQHGHACACRLGIPSVSPLIHLQQENILTLSDVGYL